jgi:predicted nuclease with TOPRIM domain
MSCTTALFYLMSGAALLSFGAMYFHHSNLLSDMKTKLQSLNTALSLLQNERSELMSKTDRMFSESASQSVALEKRNQEVEYLRSSVERLENDNQLLIREYQKLERLVLQSATR